MSGPKKIGDLSFVATRKNPEPGQIGRCFWSVRPTGDYVHDCRVGERLALEYLAFEEADMHRADGLGGGGHLQLIVGDFPREHTGVEVGFLIVVSLAAGGGANYARRVVQHWQDEAAKAA